MTKEEFEIIYNEHYKLLYKVAYGYVLNKCDSEDIVQDTFVKFYRAHKTFTSSDSLKYYLIRMTINQRIDYIRHNKKIVSVNQEDIESLPDEVSNKNEMIWECVCSLKEKYRTVIILYYYDTYSIKEIASILKISESSVKMRLSRARSILKEKIDKGLVR